MLILIQVNCMPQTPSVQWQKYYGGNNDDVAYDIELTKDGGYIIAGGSFSRSGDVTDNYGEMDCWIVKIDSLGNLQWQKNYGGTDYDEATSIRQTKDGGYIVAGRSSSTDYDRKGAIAQNYEDFWVFKINSNGVLLWKKSIGGNAGDAANCIELTKDGGYLTCGNSCSYISGHHGYACCSDGLISKLSNSGTVQWQKSIGGSGDDEGNKIIQTIDGGYLLIGTSPSTDGDLSNNNNHGGNDIYVVKLNATGTIIWDKCIGGSDKDFGIDGYQSSDSSFIIGGYSLSDDGDFLVNRGGHDCWIVKIDLNGNIIWKKSFGGSKIDYLLSLTETYDKGFVFTGWSYSEDIKGCKNNGDLDAYIVKADKSGDLMWQMFLGGGAKDEATSIRQTKDGGFIIAGWSDSSRTRIGSDGYYISSKDYWIVKLK